MDIVLEVMDFFAFDKMWATIAPLEMAGNSTFMTPHYPTFFTLTSEPLYLSTIPRDNIYRQFFSLWLITWIFGVLIYFIFASLSYYFVFDRTYLSHPKFLANQIRKEITLTMYSLPQMAIFTAPWFLAEVRGYSKLYLDPQEYGWWYMVAQFPIFLVFTDGLIYLIHRGLHHPLSVPYHLFPFIFPLQKLSYLLLFVFIQFWTIMIHDGEYLASHPMINGAANHSHHHLHFNYNYGQFFTVFDRLGGTYRMPDVEMFDAEKKYAKETWERQIKEMVEMMEEAEGEDERVYAVDVKGKKDN